MGEESAHITSTRHAPRLGYHCEMTRTVGNLNRTEFILNPALAHRQGLKLDKLLSSADLPRLRGVTRGFHQVMNQMDDERALQIAKRLNTQRY
jgi:hypothetical protein